MSDDASKKVNQDEIEALLNQAKSGGKPAAAPPPANSDASDVVSQSEIEALLSATKPPASSASGPAASNATADENDSA